MRLPIIPVGKYVLLRLDEDENLKTGIIVAIGSAIPEKYRKSTRSGLRLGIRVAILKSYIAEQYEIFRENEDSDIHFALVDFEGILGIITDQK